MPEWRVTGYTASGGQRLQANELNAEEARFHVQELMADDKVVTIKVERTNG